MIFRRFSMLFTPSGSNFVRRPVMLLTWGKAVKLPLNIFQFPARTVGKINFYNSVFS